MSNPTAMIPVKLMVRRAPIQGRKQDGPQFLPPAALYDLVIDIEILPYVKLPEGITWGQRTFFLTTDRIDDKRVYAEGFMLIHFEEPVPKGGCD